MKECMHARCGRTTPDRLPAAGRDPDLGLAAGEDSPSQDAPRAPQTSDVPLRMNAGSARRVRDSR